jgi:DNA-binding winged helix-turn-helix (wHTH) protein
MTHIAAVRDSSENAATCFGPFRLHRKARLLEKDGVPMHIGGRALDILIALAKRPRGDRQQA